MEKPLLVLKFGTSAITDQEGNLNRKVLAEITQQVAQLHRSHRIAIVSSGAVGTGKRYLHKFSGKLVERKAAAAIGNPLLLQEYATLFAQHGIAIAQSLCERHHFSQRKPFIQLRETFEELWANDIIPIANENDVVSNLELKFSDNDELATLLAVGFGAEQLLLATSVPGLLDADKNLVKEIHNFDSQVLGLAYKKKSNLGLGGMISKLTFSRLATRLGIRVVIFGLESPDNISKAVRGETGTICHPQPIQHSARNRWLASGSLVSARLFIDEGAYEALKMRKSLLAVGIKHIEGEFKQGEVIELTCPGKPSFALARSKVSSQQLDLAQKTQNLEIAHANDIVLL